ncbi:DUF3040 domain-containing protein [Streptomyces sp. NPDC002328]|uniref:DUF3040 domain-containing protein n=1 Tax=Streptomyces sp. NPDC002328 TaxID=3364642 RepID=UPI003692A7F7
MAHPGADPLNDLEPTTKRSAPRFPRGLDTGRPRRPRSSRRPRRRGPGWALLVLAAAMLIVGVTLPQGLLLASGLVTAGMATHLLTTPPPARTSDRRAPDRRASDRRTPDRRGLPLPPQARRPDDDGHHRR